jgi:signal transduction histidine kinase
MDFDLPIRVHTWSGTAVELPIWLALQVHVEKPMTFSSGFRPSSRILGGCVLLRSEASRYSISIRTELAEGLPKVMADRVQLQQVFMNLMLNGIDAMKETSGGSELAIKSETDDGQLLISVSDTGVGLPPEQGDQIFQAFFTTKDNGTGMGLPISRSIIESHGGRLWATGASGRGATFQFTLPATLAAHL